SASATIRRRTSSNRVACVPTVKGPIPTALSSLVATAEQAKVPGGPPSSRRSVEFGAIPRQLGAVGTESPGRVLVRPPVRRSAVLFQEPVEGTVCSRSLADDVVVQAERAATVPR